MTPSLTSPFYAARKREREAEAKAFDASLPSGKAIYTALAIWHAELIGNEADDGGRRTEL